MRPFWHYRRRHILYDNLQYHFDMKYWGSICMTGDKTFWHETEPFFVSLQYPLTWEFSFLYESTIPLDMRMSPFCISLKYPLTWEWAFFVWVYNTLWHETEPFLYESTIPFDMRQPFLYESARPFDIRWNPFCRSLQDPLTWDGTLFNDRLLRPFCNMTGRGPFYDRLLDLFDMTD